MKNVFIIFCFMISFFSCSKDGLYLEDIPNPNVLRSTEIDLGESHLAFPSITGNDDRSKLVLVYRIGETHISFDGEIVQLESYDKGKTWKNKRIIYETYNTDARDPQLMALSNDRLLCRFFERESDSESKVKVLISDDFGKSYNGFAEMPFPTKNETFAAARGNMVMVDDVIYAICYNRWSQSWIVKSENYGESWNVVSWVDASLGTESSSFSRINESSLGYINGTLYIVARTQEDDGYLQVGKSKDLGKNWEWDILPIRGQAPSLTPYKDGFILTYRHVNMDNNCYDFQIALLKDGKLNSTPVSLFTSTSFDIGYGDVLTLEETFLVCCYQPNMIKCYEVKYDIFN